jgi:hypothetical protein
MVTEFPSIINVTEETFIIYYRDEVAGGLGVQFENAFWFVVVNWHVDTSAL